MFFLALYYCVLLPFCNEYKLFKTTCITVTGVALRWNEVFFFFHVHRFRTGSATNEFVTRRTSLKRRKRPTCTRPKRLQRLLLISTTVPPAPTDPVKVGRIQRHLWFIFQATWHTGQHWSLIPGTSHPPLSALSPVSCNRAGCSLLWAQAVCHCHYCHY